MSKLVVKETDFLKSEYSDDELLGIYELGKLYYEMGYFAPAERIFHGLSVVDNSRTPARLGLGLVKLERGQFQEASDYFRGVLKDGRYVVLAKLGLCATFIASNEMSRAKSILVQIASELESAPQDRPELRALWEAFAIRCEQ